MEAQDETTVPKTSKSRCKNCGEKLSKRGKFCPSCGQRDFDGRIRMRDLLAKFFANITHLDNKFVKMCWHLFVPARVTLNYFEGKIKRYPHPVQFFFIVMFFFLLLFSKQFDGAQVNSTGGDFSLQVSGENPDSMGQIKKYLSESGLYGAFQHYVNAKNYRAGFDALPLEWQTPMVRQAIDSISRLVDGPWERSAKFVLEMEANTALPDGSKDSLTMNFGLTQVRISVEDLVNLSPDSIIQKYGYTSWDQKITVRQGIKSLKDPRGLVRQYVGSFGWAILVLIALMALVLRLLYWRRGGYYVEHFIFLMHQQSGAYLLLTLGLVIHQFMFKLQVGWLLVIAWIGISMLLSMKRFYQNNWAWTIAKWLIYCTVYVFGLVVLFVATLLVVFVVF
jgi:hypothetical protein